MTQYRIAEVNCPGRVAQYYVEYKGWFLWHRVQVASDIMLGCGALVWEDLTFTSPANALSWIRAQEAKQGECQTTYRYP